MDSNGSVYTLKKSLHKPGKRIRILHPSEYVFTRGYSSCGDGNTVQLVWIHSSQPIEADTVKEVMQLLQKSIAALQLSIKTKYGFYWLTPMKELEIDFEATNEDYMTVYNRIIRTTYNLKKGPLWKIRFIESVPLEGSKSPLYSSVILFSVLHSITDGPTFMTMVRETLRLLNQKMKNEPPTLNYSGLAPSLLTINKEMAPFSYLAKKFLIETWETYIRNFTHKTTFNGLLPNPYNKNAGTVLFMDYFTVDQTKKIITKCKAEKVTINTFISVCTNYALMKIAQSRTEKDLGKHNIKALHCVDGRKYFKGNDHAASGCHMLTLRFKTKHSLKENFWDAARNFQTKMRKKVDEEDQPLMLFPLGIFLPFITLRNKMNNWLSIPMRTSFHYISTNLGNLSPYLTGFTEDDPVTVEYIVRSCNQANSFCPFITSYHTLKGKLLLSLDCFTGMLPEEVGREYFNELCSLIKELSQ